MAKNTYMYEGEEVNLSFSRYQWDGSLALLLTDPETGELIAVASVMAEDEVVDEGYVVIKSYSENEGMYEWLLKNNIIKKAERWIQLGFALCPVCEINVEYSV